MEAEEAQRLPQLVYGDDVVVVLIEDVKDAAEADGVEAGAAQPERAAAEARLALVRYGASCFHGLVAEIVLLAMNNIINVWLGGRDDGWGTTERRCRQ